MPQDSLGAAARAEEVKRARRQAFGDFHGGAIESGLVARAGSLGSLDETAFGRNAGITEEPCREPSLPDGFLVHIHHLAFTPGDPFAIPGEEGRELARR